MPAVRTSDSQTKVALADLPKEFDPREEWPECESIGQIMDQSGCGSCWAFGAVTAMSDRLCINSPKDKQLKVHVSPNHLLSCCKSCGYGCDGGYPSMAWRYWQSNGLVTGSDYDSKEGCQPYSLSPCNHGGDSSLPDCQHESTPRCEKSCQSGYTTPFNEDKSYGLRPETLPSDEKIIMEELMTNGPAEAAFTVYEDFINYKSGVYKHVNGGMLGGHAVKIMGWGEENGTPYWLIANSWNYGWGENGTFKIIRGEDNCGIESSIVAALPDYKKTQL
jgi:cathepsin B